MRIRATAAGHAARSASNGPAPTPTSSGALELRSVTKRFGDLTVLRDVDLHVDAGEFVTLLGPSGSGKTTALAVVAGFESLTSGEIVLDGRVISDLPPNRRNLGIVFQNYALFPHMTVYENVAFSLRMRRRGKHEIHARVSEALELVQLAGLENRRPRELSGGQQQRVAFARVVVYAPKILLMDEPLSALDKKLRHEMQVEVRRLHRDLGTTFLYVTHDQEEALALSDRIVLMSPDGIEQVGTPQEIYERPRSAFAAAFVGDTNFLDGVVVSTDGKYAIVEVGGGRRLRGLAPTGSVAPGKSVRISVRPEHIRMTDDAAVDDGPQPVEVALEEALYLGDCVQYRGTFATGDRCLLRVGAGQSDLPAVPGVAHVVWDVDRAVVVPRNVRP